VHGDELADPIRILVDRYKRFHCAHRIRRLEGQFLYEINSVYARKPLTHKEIAAP
jgi:hypothetical protein